MDTQLTPEQIKAVKGEGFLLNRGTQLFSGRVITENGTLTAEQLAVVASAADTFGDGNVCFTARLTLEATGIAFDDIPRFQAALATAGMVTGGTGAKVRPVVACKGTTCVFGLYDTQALAKVIHDRFYVGYRNVALPHKFKIAVGGCPNNCLKPDLNDVGVVGQRVMQPNYEACRGCKKCLPEQGCPMGALKVVDGKIALDSNICNNCGRCAGKCPFHVFDRSELRYKIYVGGRWGKSIRIGTQLERLCSEDELLDVIEKTILLFKSEGQAGERFGQTCERLGLERINALLDSDELLRRKDEILGVGAAH